MNILKCCQCKKERYKPEDSIMLSCECCQVEMEVIEKNG